jgi:hypothetical protein
MKWEKQAGNSMKKESSNSWGTADHKSRLENCARRCGKGDFAIATRSANTDCSQRDCRPEGFRAKGRLALLLLGRRTTRDSFRRGTIPCAAPCSLLPENSALRSFQTGSRAGAPHAGCSSVAAPLRRLLPEGHHPFSRRASSPNLWPRHPQLFMRWLPVVFPSPPRVGHPKGDVRGANGFPKAAKLSMNEMQKVACLHHSLTCDNVAGPTNQ